jgi:hypothetical protein
MLLYTIVLTIISVSIQRAVKLPLSQAVVAAMVILQTDIAL